ncbi:alpha-hydroxy acid oxidase [Hyphomicrobium sp.]|jgi:4-hydroxymandelate oxidase|uniref:alpha-hydroxy acid oxidase n=1 Tax=Hyphomicrobium sp. TaxID=82 RepID=UPI0035699E2F
MSVEGATELPVSLADYEQQAQMRLDGKAWAYFSGGGADEITQRWNRERLDRLALIPRVLRGGPGCHTQLSLFGCDQAHPILVAPLAHQKMAHPEGELATAVGAGAQQAGMVFSMQASVSMESAAKAGPTCRWFQLYFQPLREATLQLIRRAEGAGFELLMVTVDAPVNGVRNREHRAGFQWCSYAIPENLKGLPTADAEPLSEGASAVFDHYMAVAPTWDDVAWLRQQTKLPIVLKGILSPWDAEQAIASGMNGIVVSNHGGRTLDTLPATIDVISEIAGVVGGRVPLLFDGGIRRGTDVLKALALGASAVMVGRPIIYGLSVAGALGVSHVLRLLRDEFEIAMALTGCRTLSDIGPHIIRRYRAEF